MLALALSIVTVALGGMSQAETRCGTKQLYGKRLTLYAMNVSCAEVEQITAGECDVDGEPWYCSSAHTPGPALYWRQATERYASEPTAWIEARRPPCSRSKVTRPAWDRARTQANSPFPTELQMLADDLVRCKQLRGKSRAAVLKVLRGGGLGGANGKRSLSWGIGPERTLSLPDPRDGEYFGVVFDHKGKVRSARIDTL
jgi:hypothetical protein